MEADHKETTGNSFLRSWKNVYLVVLIWHALLIIFFTVITQIFHQ